MIYWHQLNNEGDILTPEDPSPHPVAHHTKPHLSSQYVLFQWLSWSLINGFNLKQRPWGVCVCARVCVYSSLSLYPLSLFKVFCWGINALPSSLKYFYTHTYKKTNVVPHYKTAAICLQNYIVWLRTIHNTILINLKKTTRHIQLIPQNTFNRL